MHKNSKPFDGGELAKTKSSIMVAREWCLNQTWNYCCTCVPFYVCRFLKKCVGFSSFFVVGPACASAPIQPIQTANPSKKQNSKRGGKRRGPVSNRPSSTPILRASRTSEGIVPRTSEGGVVQLRLPSRREPRSTVRFLDCFVAQLDEARKRDFLVAPRRLSIANVFRLLSCLFYSDTSPC